MGLLGKLEKTIVKCLLLVVVRLLLLSSAFRLEYRCDGWCSTTSLCSRGGLQNESQKLKIQSQRIEGALVLDAHCHARPGVPPVNFRVKE